MWNNYVNSTKFEKKAVKGKDYDSIGMPTTVTELKKLEPFEFQNGVINEMKAKQSRRLVANGGLDGHIEKSLYSEEAMYLDLVLPKEHMKKLPG